MASGGGGALHSDHINYLIFRYLQESGHENAATALHRDWQRPREFRDPENYPFAATVPRHELISIVQDGLFFDELQARKVKGARRRRRWRWGGGNPREYVAEREDGERIVENGNGNGAAGSRPSSSGGATAKRKGGRVLPAPISTQQHQTVPIRAPDDFPTPAPKRQRRSEGSENVHLVNGEAMDVDASAASPSAGDEDAPAATPSMSPEPEIIEVPERYDSMDVATQTTIKTGPKTETLYWKIGKPGATILHSTWNPSPDPNSARTLLTVGEGICRFYEVPDAASTEEATSLQMKHVNDPSIPPNSIVTATAWRPDGRCAVFAVDSMRELPDGRQVPQQMLIEHDLDFGSRIYNSGPPMLEPAGIVLCVQYNPEGSCLLVVRTNIKRGLVQVFSTNGERNGEEHLCNAPVVWKVFEHQLLDACWADNGEIYVSGDKGLAESLTLISPPSHDMEDSTKAGGDHGFEAVTVWGAPRDLSYDKVRHDELHVATAFASTAARTVFAISHRQGITPLAKIDLPGQLTAMALQPGSQARRDALAADEADQSPHGRPPAGPALLAAAFEEGFCMVWVLEPAWAAAYLNKFETVAKLELSFGPALALAWSPQGTHLAVGGTDMVQIWHVDALKRHNGTRHAPLVTWRPDAAAARNGEDADEDGRQLMEPSLDWSADGESLAFAVDKTVSCLPLPCIHTSRENGSMLNTVLYIGLRLTIYVLQIAVIRFRPPLREAGDVQPGLRLQAETNGTAHSP